MGIFHFKDHCAIYKLGYQKQQNISPFHVKAQRLDTPLGEAEGRERIRDIHTYILILDLTKALQGGV